MSSNMAGGVPVSDAQGDTGPTLALQNVYLKDCSYEAPNGPRVDGNWNPQINLDLHTSATGVTPEPPGGSPRPEPRQTNCPGS